MFPLIAAALSGLSSLVHVQIGKQPAASTAPAAAPAPIAAPKPSTNPLVWIFGGLALLGAFVFAIVSLNKR